MEDNGKVMGVDFSEWAERECRMCVPRIKGLLFYRRAELTDKHYIKHVYVYNGRKFVNTGTHLIYVVGEVKKGDYLTTSPVRGAAIKCENKELAFAQVTENRVPSADEVFPVVGGVYATFL